MKIDVQHEWQVYRMACFGSQRLTRVQEVELHRAFFAGVLIGLNLTLKLAAEPEAVALGHLQDLRNQVFAQLAMELAVQA